jgi:L-2-hydroxyglutarate oxidase
LASGSYDFVIVGGGIVGLSTAMTLLRNSPSYRLLVIEKEPAVAMHQTGRNSGVIHSGIYYKPGSLKARMCRDGCAGMIEFCRTYGLPYEICGKVIVATREAELPHLDRLFQRGVENGLEVRRLSPAEVASYEPNVRCVAGIHVPSTGITSYARVSAEYARIIRELGGEIRFGARLDKVVEKGPDTVLETTAGAFHAKFVVNCAGLHSDRVARMFGVDPQCRIVPFRGEYYELKPEKRNLVKNLIYPVPDPDFPFLGVHFTRMIDGSVHAGPNAVLGFKREGYHKTDFNASDFAEIMLYPGFWRLARKHAAQGTQEMVRSIFKKRFVQTLQQLIPALTDDDVIPTHAGVRAQALKPSGAMVDDFLIVHGYRSVHVCNAPSPAATASLEIGKAVAAVAAQAPGATEMLGAGSR